MKPTLTLPSPSPRCPPRSVPRLSRNANRSLNWFFIRMTIQIVALKHQLLVNAGSPGRRGQTRTLSPVSGTQFETDHYSHATFATAKGKKGNKLQNVGSSLECESQSESESSQRKSKKLKSSPEESEIWVHSGCYEEYASSYGVKLHHSKPLRRFPCIADSDEEDDESPMLNGESATFDDSATSDDSAEPTNLGGNDESPKQQEAGLRGNKRTVGGSSIG